MSDQPDPNKPDPNKPDPNEPDPKNHDEPHAEAQVGADAGVEPDKIGSPSKDSDAGKKILESAAKPAGPGDAANEAGIEGTGFSTLHVTGTPEAAEKAFQEAPQVEGQPVQIGAIVTYREGDYEVSAEGGGTNPEGTNGTREHPAIVTRVWPNGWVNLAVAFDGMGVFPRMSVAPEGAKQSDAPEGVQVSGGNACWYWPA